MTRVRGYARGIGTGRETRVLVLAGVMEQGNTKATIMIAVAVALPVALGLRLD